MTPPCKGCTDRYITCHSECEAYKAFRAERDRQIEERLATAYPYEALDKCYTRKLKRKKNPRFIPRD